MSRDKLQRLAQIMLDTRHANYSWAFILRLNGLRFILTFVLFGMVIVLLELAGRRDGALLFLGLLAGALLRDIGWIRNYRSTSGFTMLVVDWEKVQRLADGDVLAEYDH